MFWKDLQNPSTDRKCRMISQPSQNHRRVVHLWSVQKTCTPKMLPWLPPFCFTQDPQYTHVNLHHNQPYNLSESLWAVIFIEFLIMLQIRGDMILWLSWGSCCGASEGGWSSCMAGKGLEGQVCQQKSQWIYPETNRKHALWINHKYINIARMFASTVHQPVWPTALIVLSFRKTD